MPPCCLRVAAVFKRGLPSRLPLVSRDPSVDCGADRKWTAGVSAKTGETFTKQEFVKVQIQVQNMFVP